LADPSNAYYVGAMRRVYERQCSCIAQYNASALQSRHGTQAGAITNSAGGVLYTSVSDYRLKQDLKEYNGLELISSIKTYDYELKLNSSRMYGVMAHELQEVIPYAVNGEKDGKNMQGVDYSKLVPIMIKAIQELKAEIDELKNK
jgi:hypothetical protein